jgi:RNA polymerase sigma factor (sigma-70 family)
MMAEHENLPIERWSDERLLRAAHKGNEKAFQIFCARSLPSLTRYLSNQCRQLGVPVDLSRDFAQEAILKALTHIRFYQDESFVPAPKVSVAWLRQIGYHLVVDWMRTNRRSKKAWSIIHQVKSATPTAEEQEQYEELLKFYTWLPPTEKEIIELVLLEGLHPLDAGAKMGLTDQAAYKAYERALVHLRDFIRTHGSLADKPQE